MGLTSMRVTPVLVFHQFLQPFLPPNKTSNAFTINPTRPHVSFSPMFGSVLKVFVLKHCNEAK